MCIGLLECVDDIILIFSSLYGLNGFIWLYMALYGLQYIRVYKQYIIQCSTHTFYENIDYKAVSKESIRYANYLQGYNDLFDHASYKITYMTYDYLHMFTLYIMYNYTFV